MRPSRLIPRSTFIPTSRCRRPQKSLRRSSDRSTTPGCNSNQRKAPADNRELRATQTAQFIDIRARLADMDLQGVFDIQAPAIAPPQSTSTGWMTRPGPRVRSSRPRMTSLQTAPGAPDHLVRDRHRLRTTPESASSQRDGTGLGETGQLTSGVQRVCSTSTPTGQADEVCLATFDDRCSTPIWRTTER